MKSLKVKKLLIVICVFSMMVCMGFAVNSFICVRAEETVSNTVETVSFTMDKGASVRLSGSEKENGLRYSVRMPKAEYEALKANNTYKSISFGLLLAPKSYLTSGHELTKENVFGNNAIYDWATYKNGEWVYPSEPTGKIRIMNFETEYLTETAPEVMRFYGSIVDLKPQNISKEFYSVGYIKYVLAENGSVDYRFTDNVTGNDGTAEVLGDNTTRSMYQVAKLAIEDTSLNAPEYKQKEFLQENYIDVSDDLLGKHRVKNSAVKGGGALGGTATVTAVTDETKTCNSYDALELKQGTLESEKFPLYWIDLTTLNNGQGLDITKRVLEFDVRFGKCAAINVDFLDKESTQTQSKASQLWLGGGSSPIINTADDYNSKGFSFARVSGKDDWYHVTLNLAEANIQTGGYNLQNTGYLRIICVLSGDTAADTLLACVDNLYVNSLSYSEYRKYTTVSNSAVTGNFGNVTTVTDETCNSEDALKLTQGAEGVRYPHYWVNLTTLNNGQGLDVTKRVLEFDIKLLFGEVYEINIDFLDKESTQHTSKTSQLWLGNGSSPVINDRDTFNSKGFTCVAVEGKPGWYHVTLDLSEAEIATEGFNLQNTGYLRIICSLSKDQPENATLCYIDNVVLNYKSK